jgi:two-component system CheB/CheR fusion protein
VIDSLPEHVAMLDIHGTVRRVNRAWDRFASQNGGPEGAPPGQSVGVGANYLAVLARATTPDAMDVMRGLQQVLSGRIESYRTTYPCHSPTEQRWFVMTATALHGGEQGAVVSHFDITPWRSMIEPEGGASDV